MVFYCMYMYMHLYVINYACVYYILYALERSFKYTYASEEKKGTNKHVLAIAIHYNLCYTYNPEVQDVT